MFFENKAAANRRGSRKRFISEKASQGTGDDGSAILYSKLRAAKGVCGRPFRMRVVLEGSARLPESWKRSQLPLFPSKRPVRSQSGKYSWLCLNHCSSTYPLWDLGQVTSLSVPQFLHW